MVSPWRKKPGFEERQQFPGWSIHLIRFYFEIFNKLKETNCSLLMNFKCEECRNGFKTYEVLIIHMRCAHEPFRFHDQKGYVLIWNTLMSLSNMIPTTYLNMIILFGQWILTKSPSNNLQTDNGFFFNCRILNMYFFKLGWLCHRVIFSHLMHKFSLKREMMNINTRISKFIKRFIYHHIWLIWRTSLCNSCLW